MKKFLKDVVVTFAILGLICTIFYKIGWLVNLKEVLTLFAIAFVVIVANKTVDIIIAMIHSRK